MRRTRNWKEDSALTPGPFCKLRKSHCLSLGRTDSLGNIFSSASSRQLCSLYLVRSCG